MFLGVLNFGKTVFAGFYFCNLAKKCVKNIKNMSKKSLKKCVSQVYNFAIF